MLPHHHSLSFTQVSLHPAQTTTAITMHAVFLSPVLTLFLLVSAIFCLFFRSLLFQWHHHKGKRLPPGSMGWPFFGETLKLYAQNPNTFFFRRQMKYGDIFKTYILGCPCVMISNPDFVRVVLVSHADYFKPTYPPSKEKIIGPEFLVFHHGDYHSGLKRVIQASLLPSAIKRSIRAIEQIVLEILPSWENNTINTLKEMKKFTLDVAMLTVFGGQTEIATETMKYLCYCLDKGYNSMPFNLPGTAYRKALTARKLLNDTVMEVIKKRREQGNKKDDGGHGGLLEVLLMESNRITHRLSDSQIADNVIGVIFAARDTSASVITWILKYLHDNPKILSAVMSEQDEILRRRTEEKRSLTWEDTRRMPMTSQVIQETLRIASVLSFTFREAVQDVEIEGHIIPKGWKVLPVFRSIHLSSHFFPEPDKFDPSRFKVQPRPNTYMPFGNGVHSCPGNELAKLEMLILLHHLTITYRWEIIGNADEMEYSPFLVPKHGLPIWVTTRAKTTV